MLQAIKAFAERAVDATHIHEKLVIGVVLNAPQIELATGLDVRDYSQTLDNFGLKHGFKHHGNELRETLRGQRAVRLDDVLNVPEALSMPDRIKFEGVSKYSRQPVISFEKAFGSETLVYVAEVRKGRRELATQTFYIRCGK